MVPPIHVFGDPNADWVIVLVSAAVCLYWLRALRLAREGARLFLRNLAKAALAFCGVMVILATVRGQTNFQSSQEPVIAGIVAFILFCRLASRKRSRYVPKAARRAVIARDLRGEDFDPERHHLDHIWPFSRGGSHTVDNLRVIEKKKNLLKGAKRPRMRDMW